MKTVCIVWTDNRYSYDTDKRMTARGPIEKTSEAVRTIVRNGGMILDVYFEELEKITDVS